MVMESKMVCNALMEMFPKVDSRALRAVAIEHSKDVDAAVVTVLQEIIPFFVDIERQRSDTDYTCSTPRDSDDESSDASQCALVRRQDVDASSLDDEHHEELHETQLVMPEKFFVNETKMSSFISPGGYVVLTDEINADTLQEVGASVNQEMDPVQQSEEVLGDLQSDSTAPSEETVPVNAFEDENKFSDRNYTSQAPDMREGDLDNTLGADVSTVVSDDPNAVQSQDSPIQAIDVLEEVITHARNSKGTLSSALESVLLLIQEVELNQAAAEKAKEEAAKGGAHILNKVDELKQMLQHAKEANDMHSGEVYGEKAILAAELKEVQNRVFSLLDEKDKALGILDEMRQALEERLAAALDIINSAEKEKAEKEMAARKLYADQELVMEKVVHESMMLKQQAEENSKLQEFLLDRGCVLDMLHGEMAVICQDVKLLKEKFDSGLPLSKSLSSSHSSSFMLASSNSPPKKPSIEDQTEAVLGRDDPISALTEEERDIEEETARKNRIDDGWDFVD